MLQVETNPIHNSGFAHMGKETTKASKVALGTYDMVRALFEKKRTIRPILVPVRVHTDYNYWGGSLQYYVDWILHVIQRCWAYYHGVSKEAAKKLSKINAVYSSAPMVLYEGPQASQQAYSTIKFCIDGLNRNENNFLLQSKNLRAIESVLGIEGAIAACRETIEEEPQDQARTERGYAVLRYFLDMQQGEGFYTLPQDERMTEEQFSTYLRSLSARFYKNPLNVDINSVLFNLVAKDVGKECERQMKECQGALDPEFIAERLLSLGYPRYIVGLAFVVYMQHTWEKSEQIASKFTFNTIATIYTVLLVEETKGGMCGEAETYVWLELTKSLTTPYLLLNRYMEAFMREAASLLTDETNAPHIAAALFTEINGEWAEFANEKLLLGYLAAQNVREEQLEKVATAYKMPMKKQLFEVVQSQLDDEKWAPVKKVLSAYLEGTAPLPKESPFCHFSRMYDRILGP